MQETNIRHVYADKLQQLRCLQLGSQVGEALELEPGHGVVPSLENRRLAKGV